MRCISHSNRELTTAPGKVHEPTCVKREQSKFDPLTRQDWQLTTTKRRRREYPPAAFERMLIEVATYPSVFSPDSTSPGIPHSSASSTDARAAVRCLLSRPASTP